MIADAFLTQSVMGASPVAAGLNCTPTVPASLAVNIGPGSLTNLAVVDANAYGSLPADTTDALLKTGINLTSTPFTLAAPTTSGQSINYLIEAAFSEVDALPLVLPYYNAANPSQPYSGPTNTGVAQNTVRQQRVALRLSPGAPAVAGTQTTPAADTGYSPLWIITVAYGQAAVTAANIVQHPQAPFVAWRLPTLPTYFLRRGNATGATQEDNYTLPNNGSHQITLTFTSTVPGVLAAWASTNISGQAPGINQLGVTINGVTPAADRTPFPMSVSGVVPVGAGLQTISSTYSTSSSGNPNCGHTLSYLFVPN